MNQEACYALLENKFLMYRDYASIPVVDNGDLLVPIGPEFEGKVSNYEEMQPSLATASTFGHGLSTC